MNHCKRTCMFSLRVSAWVPREFHCRRVARFSAMQHECEPRASALTAALGPEPGKLGPPALGSSWKMLNSPLWRRRHQSMALMPQGNIRDLPFRKATLLLLPNLTGDVAVGNRKPAKALRSCWKRPAAQRKWHLARHA